MIYDTPPKDFKPKLAVAACFIEHGNTVFFLQRSVNVSQPGTWAIPGGKIDDGETPQQAVTREVLEETGIKLKNPEFLHTVYIRYPDYDYEYHMFKEVTVFKPTVNLDVYECAAHAWLTRAQVNALEADNKLILDEMPCIEKIYNAGEFGAKDARSVCVFCGADDKMPAKYKTIAFELGARLARLKMHLVTGGGSIGLMKEINSGHASVDLQLPRYGVIPNVFKGFNVHHPEIAADNLHWVDNMYERITGMYALSDDIIVLPGGYGTLYELMDCLVHNQFDQIKKHIFILNIDNFWQPLIEQFKAMLQSKTLAPEHFEYITVVDNLEDLLECLTNTRAKTLERGFASRYWETAPRSLL